MGFLFVSLSVRILWHPLHDENIIWSAEKMIIYINFIIFDWTRKASFYHEFIGLVFHEDFRNVLGLIGERKNCRKHHCWGCNQLGIVSISPVISVIDIFYNRSLVISSPFDVFVDFHLTFHLF